MPYQLITYKNIAKGIALITLNRPGKRNALNCNLMRELLHVIEEAGNDQSCRAVILAAEGPVFSAGMDLAEAADIALEETIAQHIARLFTAIYTSTIAAVQGDAIAGGGGLAAACDFAVAAKEVRIGFPETRRGLVAAQVAVLLCRQLSMRSVRELLLFGELINVDRALAMGLVGKVTEKDQLLEEALRYAEMILQGAPLATRATKGLLARLEHARFADDLQTALAFHHAARHSAEAKEGVAAFLEKRPPAWVRTVP